MPIDRDPTPLDSMESIKARVNQELESRKTKDMLRLEVIFDTDIVELIAPNSLMTSAEIATMLGITEGTLSKWRTLMMFRNVRRHKPGPKVGK
mgnify:CR=1 FL=1|jgi:DNA-binding transcriptional regulator YiaG